MKTLVIQLDRTEDPGSIRDKVTWGKSSRVLLVWPVNHELFDRKLDLVMIKRTCTTQGSRLGIVCDDPVVCAEAEELQIPIFESVNRAMRKGWDRRRRRWFFNPLPDKPDEMMTLEELRTSRPHRIPVKPIPSYLRILLFTAGVLALLAICLFILPSAEVKVYPVSQAQDITIDFTVENRAGGTVNPGILHGTVITISLDSEVSRPTTGKTHAPDKKANGSVSFSNLTDKELEVKAKTIVYNNANPPVAYTLLKDVTIPAGGVSEGVEIEAIYAGKAGNTPENTVTRMDGEIGMQVQITNPSAIAGGTERDIPAASAEDIVALRKDMLATQLLNAEQQLSRQLTPDQILLVSSMKPGQVKNETLTPPEGEPAVTVRLKQTVEFSAMVIDHRQFVDQSEALLIANRLLPGWQLSKRQPVEVSILSQEYDRVTNSVKVKAAIRGQMIPIVDTQKIQKIITGRDRSLVPAIISILVLTDKPAVVETWPSWLPFTPLVQSRIQVTTP